MSVFAILALLAYSFSLALIIPSLLRKQSAWRRLAVISATLALVCHAVTLQQRIFLDGGQNLSLLNIGSLVSLLICAIMTIVASRNRGWILIGEEAAGVQAMRFDSRNHPVPAVRPVMTVRYRLPDRQEPIRE